MVAVRVMEMPLHKIVNVVTMRDCGVAAIRPMNVFCGVLRRGKTGRAVIGIPGADRNHMFIHMVAVRMVQMPVVKIIHMALMFDGGMAATRTMNVRMLRVRRASFLLAHNFELVDRCSTQHHRPVPGKDCFCKSLAPRESFQA